MFKGKANPEFTARFLDSKKVHPGQRRKFCGVELSSLGFGTYLGQMDEVTDAKVTVACLQSYDLGCCFFDTAVNYRGQRAEKSIGEAVRRLILSGTGTRENIFVSSKAGFVPYEGKPSNDIPALFREQYVDTGIAKESDLIAGCHCMAPAYLENQIDRSRKNMNLETIDLYYLHNPETQLEELPERVFYEKLESAFYALEKAVQKEKIGAYGLATWDGFRQEPGAQTALKLEQCVLAAVNAAKQAGSAQHSLKAIQLPLNLAMPEAALVKTQWVNLKPLSAIEAAKTLGLDVAVSVPLFQGRLCHNLPDFLLETFPKDLSQAHCALAFATSFAHVDCAMVGMKAKEHVEHNLEFLKHAPLEEEELHSVLSAMAGGGQRLRT